LGLGAVAATVAGSARGGAAVPPWLSSASSLSAVRSMQSSLPGVSETAAATPGDSCW
jgi:hypothetical protein